jgi:hypothetical protein
VIFGVYCSFISPNLKKGNNFASFLIGDMFLGAKKYPFWPRWGVYDYSH